MYWPIKRHFLYDYGKIRPKTWSPKTNIHVLVDVSLYSAAILSTGVIFIAYIIRTLHDCPSQMNGNLLISNSKLTSDSELIW